MFKSYTDYNFQGNQLLNVVLHKAPTPPLTPTNGQIYFNTNQRVLYIYDDYLGIWRKVGSDISNVTAGDGIFVGHNINTDTNQVEYTINVDVNTAHLVIEAYTDAGVDKSRVSIKNQGITTSKLADSNVTTIKLADKSVTFTKMDDIIGMSVIGNMSQMTGKPSAISVLTDLNATSSASQLINAQGVKAYIDASVAGLGSLRGGFDASVETTLPGSGLSNNFTKKGDYWFVTKPGTITANGVSETFNVGDVIIANKTNPANDYNDYIRLESNRDVATTTVLGMVRLATSQEVIDGTGDGVVTAKTLNDRVATTQKSGLVRLANSAEVSAGTSTTTALTPADVKSLFDGKTVIAPFGDGTSLSYVIPHNLNTTNLHIDFYEANGTRVNCGVTNTTNTTITVVSKPAPLATAKITAVITRAK